MGQATLDLPDPGLSGLSAGPMSAEALASADDLLSQLAGDDIDRLLAEAEAERPPTLPPATLLTEAVALPAVPSETLAPVAEVAVAAADASTAAAIDAILAPAIESSLKAVETHLEASTPSAPDVVSAETVAPTLPEQLQPSRQESAVAAADQKVLDDAAAHVAAIMDVPAAASELPPLAATTDAAERQALSEPLIIPIPEARPPGILARLLLTILEWINSPMRLLPEAARDALGKIAIVTMCNAIAVILYVMLFRRSHH